MSNETSSRRKWTRRDTLRLGALAGAAAVLPVERLANALGRPPRNNTLPPFSVPMPVPPVARPIATTSTTDYYAIAAYETWVNILPHVTTRLRTFDGGLPGPTIKAKAGRRTIVTYSNRLDLPIAVHLHGGHVPPESDGHPLDLIQPGRNRDYVYPNTQRAATLWYHDHAHHTEAENVYRGLSGCYIISDDEEQALGLPSGQYDVPLLIRDADLADDGTLIYDAGGFSDRKTVLVNGQPRPYFRVAARKYRFRLVNVSNERSFQLRLSTGDEFIQIATDGGLLPAPVRTPVVDLWSAERVEVVVDFSRYPIGTRVVLENTQPLTNEPSEVMCFDVVRTASDNSRVPDRLTTLPPLDTATVTRDFVLSFDSASRTFLINGKAFDPNRVDVRTKLGTTEIWRITNADTAFGIPHSFHTHLVQFRVLDRDGVPVAATEAGLKDTVSIPAGQTVRIQMRWGDYTGRYMYHCHFLEHSTHAMMGQLEITR